MANHLSESEFYTLCKGLESLIAQGKTFPLRNEACKEISELIGVSVTLTQLRRALKAIGVETDALVPNNHNSSYVKEHKRRLDALELRLAELSKSLLRANLRITELERQVPQSFSVFAPCNGEAVS